MKLHSSGKPENGKLTKECEDIFRGEYPNNLWFNEIFADWTLITGGGMIMTIFRLQHWIYGYE